MQDPKQSAAGLTNEIQEQESEEKINLNLNSSQTIKMDKQVDEQPAKGSQKAIKETE